MFLPQDGVEADEGMSKNRAGGVDRTMVRTYQEEKPQDWGTTASGGRWGRRRGPQSSLFQSGDWLLVLVIDDRKIAGEGSESEEEPM